MTTYLDDIVPDKDDGATDTAQGCWKIRYELKKCMMESDCIKLDKKPVRYCLNNKSANVSESCRNLQYTYAICRKSMLDMRSRFRGRKGES